MIKNERQYRITKARIGDPAAAIERALQAFPDMSARRRRAMVEALHSNIESMADEVREYESIRDHGLPMEAHSLEELPLLLIKARIARGWTQRDLAQALGVAEQQVQRDEAMDYQGTSLTRIANIAKALGVTLVVQPGDSVPVGPPVQAEATIGRSETVAERMERA